MKIKENTFGLFLMKRRYFFGAPDVALVCLLVLKVSQSQSTIAGKSDCRCCLPQARALADSYVLLQVQRTVS